MNHTTSSHPATQASVSTNLAKATWPGAGGAGGAGAPGGHKAGTALALTRHGKTSPPPGGAAICFPFCPCRTSNAGHWLCTQSPNSKITGQQPRQPHVAMGSLLAHQRGSETEGQFPCSSLPTLNRRPERSQLVRAWTTGREGGSWGPQSKETLSLEASREQQVASVPGIPHSSSYS